MHSVFALAAPAALGVAMIGGHALPYPQAMPQLAALAADPEAPAALGRPAASGALEWLQSQMSAGQVRIEQRVMIRVAPAPSAVRQDMLAQSLRSAPSRRLVEGRKEKCVPLQGIAGVETGSGNRLVLFLRDRRMLSVNLDKSCRARDFYSGFYVEPRKDGRLCVDRDKLQSRTGARCEVEAMRQLVLAGD